MPRANRHYLPGYVWHITHRCHKQEFLLKFNKDRQRWLHWLFEAKKRYGLSVLNYVVTSNHIHLLVVDTQEGVIAKSIQLIAGRTAQEYNQRKKRKGAFWEDRYHAVAVATEKYLMRCLVYIDLNMVRAGVVMHPRDWCFGGYNEIFNPPERYRIIDRQSLMEKCGYEPDSEEIFLGDYNSWVNESLSRGSNRESHWTDSLAVGGEEFVLMTKAKLGLKSKRREVTQFDDTFSLNEPNGAYSTVFNTQNSLLSNENAHSWCIND